uniref:Protein kinase domain-containing protein n=1 Tax=Macrostomum lignano TaxID=282301 RepID=A0A1I8HC36_9PLAT
SSPAEASGTSAPTASTAASAGAFSSAGAAAPPGMWRYLARCLRHSSIRGLLEPPPPPPDTGEAPADEGEPPLPPGPRRPRRESRRRASGLRRLADEPTTDSVKRLTLATDELSARPSRGVGLQIPGRQVGQVHAISRRDSQLIVGGSSGSIAGVLILVDGVDARKLLGDREGGGAVGGLVGWRGVKVFDARDIEARYQRLLPRDPGSEMAAEKNRQWEGMVFLFIFYLKISNFFNIQSGFARTSCGRSGATRADSMPAQFLSKLHQTMPQMLLLALLAALTADSLTMQRDSSQRPASSVIRVNCRLYRRRGPIQPVLLDCRPDAVAGYVERGFAFRRQAMLLMPPTTDQQDDDRRRPVWMLDETTLVKTGDTDVNILPREAFASLAETVKEGHLLSLRRLRQRRLDLSALSSLPQLRHLEVAESNATCLSKDMFDPVPRLETACCPACSRTPDRPGPPGRAQHPRQSAPEVTQCRSRGAIADRPSAGRPSSASWDGALCQADGLRRLRLDRLPQKQLLLAGLAGLRSLRVDDHEEETMLSVIKLAPAACALWPDGRLLLNGISLANWTLGQMLQDFAQFCEYVIETEDFAEQAEQLCSSAARQLAGNCFAECSTPVAAAAADTVTKDQPASVTGVTQVNSHGGWHVDKRGILGTALLTAGAFLGGVLAAAYCCSSGRLVGRGSKPSVSGSAASSGGVSTVCVSGGCHLPELEDDEPIRLIGYSAKSTTSLPALPRPPSGGPLMWTV